MGKKNSLKVLIVGDIIQNLIVGDIEGFLNCKEIRVEDCGKALGITLRHPSYFDFMFIDTIGKKVNGTDFVDQFIRLSPMTKIVYMVV